MASKRSRRTGGGPGTNQYAIKGASAGVVTAARAATFATSPARTVPQDNPWFVQALVDAESRRQHDILGNWITQPAAPQACQLVDTFAASDGAIVDWVDAARAHAYSTVTCAPDQVREGDLIAYHEPDGGHGLMHVTNVHNWDDGTRSLDGFHAYRREGAVLVTAGTVLLLDQAAYPGAMELTRILPER